MVVSIEIEVSGCTLTWIDVTSSLESNYIINRRRVQLSLGVYEGNGKLERNEANGKEDG